MKYPSTIGCSIFLLSGSALAYEVILVRLLSMTRFYHLAFMVLSLALLGYGVSGVFLAYFRKRFLGALPSWFTLFAALFALGAVACFQLSQHIPLHPGQWLWSPFEAAFLVLLYLVLSLPFLAAACGVGLAYCSPRYDAGPIYRADLLGAATGSLGAISVLWLPQAQGLWLPWCGGLAAASVMLLRKKKPLAVGLILLAVAGPIVNPSPAVQLIPSADKPLTIALSAEGARKTTDIFTPVGRITVTRNTQAPHRLAPGLSLAYTRTVPAQWLAFNDGESYAPLLLGDPKDDITSHLDFLPEALVYHLKNPGRVLVLDSYATEHPARAVSRGASTVAVVMSNPGWQTLHGDLSRTFEKRYETGALMRLSISAPREFLKAGRPSWDLIVMAQPGQSALQSSHLHTVETLCLALSKLSPKGVLSISGPSDLPPRTALRLLSTAAEALRRCGVSAPAQHLAMIRSLRTVHLMVPKNPFSDDDIAGIRNFCRERRFDPVWFPGMKATEANRWNRLATPVFFQSAMEILGPRADDFHKQYKFDISPVFDDRPFFSHFLKIRTLKELFELRGGGGLGMLSYAEPVLAATLLQALLLSLLLVWLPLRRYRASVQSTQLGTIYLVLGIGFMLVEYAVLEKMSLFLNEPVLAVAVTLAGFLAMAGLGGGITSRWYRSQDRMLKKAGIAALLVAGLVLLYLMILPALLNTLMGIPLLLRIPLALLLIMPLALAMGFPFPLALSGLKKIEKQAVPWAWGLNGCGSLIGPILGITLAIYGGISMVLWVGIGCYTAVFAFTSIRKLN